MSKALIDLSRANTPPKNPLADKQPATEAISNNPDEATANINVPAAMTEKEKLAPKPIVNERVSTIGARIPESLHQQIKLFCIANRIEMQHFVQEALTRHLELLKEGPQDA